MSKRDMEQQLAGAQWAIDRIKAVGLEQAEKEFKRRGADNYTLRISDSDITEFENAVKANTVDTIMLMSLVTLRDQFSFGKKRLLDFMDRFLLKQECLRTDPDVTWQMQHDILVDEVGLDLPQIRWNGGEPPKGC